MRTGLLCTTMVLGLIESNTADARRPNIVFAFGDDYGRYASVYAELEKDNRICRLIHTPNFDRIAKEGVLFTNAYVPAPSSTPCRSSVLSGQYFWRTGRGAYLEGAEWDESIPSYPLLLEKNGYHIGFTFKVWGPGKNIDAPYGGDTNRYSDHGGRFNQFSQYVVAAGKGNYEKAKQELYEETVANFKAFLTANKEGKPFCYWWGPTNTHRPWEKGSGRELWGIDPDDLKGKLPENLPDIPEIREDFADYLGECMAFDAGLGVLLSVLEETHQLDNTIIVVSGDHGIPGFPRAKCNLYEAGIKVGLAIRYPEMVAGGRVVTDFVNLMDLAPTFLDLAGAPIPDVMTGRSLKPILADKKNGRIDETRNYVISGRERHVRTAREGNLPYPQRSLVMDRFKYIRNFGPTRWPMGSYQDKWLDCDGGPTKTWFFENYSNPDYDWYMQLNFGKRPYEELYDLREDPDETVNLARHPKYQRVIEWMSKRMDDILAASGDPRMQESMCVFDQAEFTGL